MRSVLVGAVVGGVIAAVTLALFIVLYPRLDIDIPRALHGAVIVGWLVVPAVAGAVVGWSRRRPA